MVSTTVWHVQYRGFDGKIILNPDVWMVKPPFFVINQDVFRLKTTVSAMFIHVD
jgi:hypothetical protein